MKRYQNWVSLFSIPVILIAAVVGCDRNIAVAPTIPGITNTHTFTFTPVITNTATLSPTNTPTNSATSSPTNSPVVANTNTPTNSPTNSPIGANTNTATNTPTNSPTNSNTNTPTNTPTNSNTNTATNTPLVSNTPTSTATNCTAAAYQATYNLDTTLQCWQLAAPSAPYVTTYGITGNNPQSGTGSLQVVVNNTTGSTQNINLNVTFATPQNLSGMEMIAYVYVDPSLASAGTTYSSGIQIYDQTGPNWTSPAYAAAPWVTVEQPSTNVGAWFPVTLVFGALGNDPTQVLQFGVQLSGVPAGATGNFYIDNIQIIAAPPTPTNTPVPTNTMTNSPTNTITNTPPTGSTATNSPTNTPTSTPTSGCPLPLAAPYTFNTDIGCWVTDNLLTTTTVNWAAAPPAGSPSGGGAFQAVVAYNSAVSQLTEEFQVPLPANTDLTGKLITMSIYIDNSVKGTAWGGGIQTYVKTGPTFTFCNKPWVNITGFGGWYTYTMDLTSVCTAGLTDTRAIGVQVIIATGSGSGNIYIDDVTVTAPPPTATPTATPAIGWTYEDGTNQYWALAYNPATAVGAVTTLAGINAGVISGSDPSVYGFDIHFPTGLTGGTNDAQVECNAASGSPIIGAGMNWSTLNITSVTIQYWANLGPTNYNCAVFPYVRAGGGANNYGGNYNGWPGSSGGAGGYQANNTWQSITFTPTAAMGTWSTDETLVTAVGVDMNLSIPQAANGGDIVIDNITLQ